MFVTNSIQTTISFPKNIISVSHLNHDQSMISFNIQIGLYFPRFYSHSPFFLSMYTIQICSKPKYALYSSFFFSSCLLRSQPKIRAIMLQICFGFIRYTSQKRSTMKGKQHANPRPKSDSCLFNCLASFE